MHITHTNLSVIYTTVATQEQAEQLIFALLEKELITCANFFAITSIYRWQDAIEHNQEIALILKTPTQTQALYESLQALHPYKAPCIIPLTHQVL